MSRQLRVASVLKASYSTVAYQQQGRSRHHVGRRDVSLVNRWHSLQDRHPIGSGALPGHSVLQTVGRRYGGAFTYPLLMASLNLRSFCECSKESAFPSGERHPHAGWCMYADVVRICEGRPLCFVPPLPIQYSSVPMMDINNLINHYPAELGDECRTTRMGSEGALSSASSTSWSFVEDGLPSNQAGYNRRSSWRSHTLSTRSSPRFGHSCTPDSSRRRSHGPHRGMTAIEKQQTKNQKERKNRDHMNNSLGALISLVLDDNPQLQTQVRRLTKVNIGPKADVQERHLDTPLRYTKQSSIATSSLMYRHQTLMTEYTLREARNGRVVDVDFFDFCMRSKGTAEFPEHDRRFQIRPRL
ncbi:uncharacterized protein EI97DRAFT_445122 [Westerdykella ornata]|uniref:BHLH domain-containing protein n=1 Tax=Westerdykella ornata TaxID=318751 RepID=A0A6A6J9E8_WESOR|nr:uncharacterized protein EI97DRAFT_445122 [Westerdykella ornata]KAF2273200.1 hypothetical protein EI97DRAFT_445122 [Westerdykella ornata]